MYTDHFISRVVKTTARLLRITSNAVVITVFACMIAVQAAGMLVLEKWLFRQNGRALSSLVGMKEQFLHLAFPPKTAAYLQAFPLFAFTTLIYTITFVPLVLAIVAAIGHRNSHDPGSPPRLNVPLERFTALWLVGFGLCLFAVGACSVLARVFDAPITGRELWTTALRFCYVLGFSLCPPVALLTLLGTLVRSRIVLAVCGAAGVGAMRYFHFSGSARVPWWGHIYPRTIENALMSTGTSANLAGIAGLLALSGLLLALAWWAPRYRGRSRAGAVNFESRGAPPATRTTANV
jgi:hypothetical protein